MLEVSSHGAIRYVYPQDPKGVKEDGTIREAVSEAALTSSTGFVRPGASNPAGCCPASSRHNSHR